VHEGSRREQRWLIRVSGIYRVPVTYLCVPIFVTELAKARRDIALAAEGGADMVELRIDHVSEQAQQVEMVELLRDKLMPVIVTCRPTWEGGYSPLSDEARMLLIMMAAEAGAIYTDTELKTMQRLPNVMIGLNQLPQSQLAHSIISFHDFTGRPDRLYNIIHELNTVPAGINKIVWTARTVRDNLEAFELLGHRNRPTIALCMGEAGLISRVLAKKFGAFLTFASLDADSGTAPGQITLEEMKKLYRWDAIKPSTKVYGVVAHPVRHSMSPAIHNAAFDAAGHDGIYLPLLVEPSYESFKAFMESFLAMVALDLAGLSITIPHKENALKYLLSKGAEVEPLAQRIGAVNTIAIERGNSGAVTLRGSSTDYAAILDSITAAMGADRAALAGRRVAVLGAGGTGRTAVAALAHCGADIRVANRTFDRARALADEFNGRSGKVEAAEIEQLISWRPDVWINTTSVGMHPNVDQSPLGDAAPQFAKDSIVFDTVYNPRETRLLAHARAAGVKTIDGLEMFVRQAAAQFEIWTSQPAPRDVMRRVVEDRLGRQD
jgi:3-dehydroquinate dehydratase/shikimate dehydrogenase